MKMIIDFTMFLVFIISLTFILTLFSSSVKSSYCDLNFNPVLSINNTATGNMTKISADKYCYNNTNGNWCFTLDCSKTSTFFIIPQEIKPYYQFVPNQTQNMSFFISPVTLNKNFIIRGFGVNAFNKTIMNISQPYLFNDTILIPLSVSVGNYSQTYEITDGSDVKYMNTVINVPTTNLPQILSVNIPTNLEYYNDFEVGALVTDNVEKVTIAVMRDGWLIRNESAYNDTGKYYKATLYADYPSNKIVVNASNKYFYDVKEITVNFDKVEYSIKDLSYPAMTKNQTNKIYLINFDTDHPVTATVTINKLTNNSFEISAINENNGAIDSGMATSFRNLDLAIKPLVEETSTASLTISGDLIDPPSSSIKISWVGSQFTNPPIINLSYFSKPTLCTLKGETILNSSYDCCFNMPVSYNYQNLEINEIELLKQKYQIQIDTCETKKEETNTRFTVVVIVLIIIALILLGRWIWKKGFIFGFGGKKE